MMRGQDPDPVPRQRAQQGDEAAFEQLRRKYRPLVGAEIRKRLSGVGGDDLEDIAQGVWLAVWNALPRFRGDAAFGTWVVAITRNVVLEWIRRRTSAEQSLVCALHAIAGDEPAWEDRFLGSLAVHDAVKQLSPTEREAIHLRYFLQLTDEEIAQKLDAPLGTVKSRLRAALGKLRARLEDPPGEQAKCRGKRD